MLTSTIAGTSALGLPLQTAVRQSVFMHRLAGDLTAEDRGEVGITAQDIPDSLPLATKMSRGGLYEAPTSHNQVQGGYRSQER